LNFEKVFGTEEGNMENSNGKQNNPPTILERVSRTIRTDSDRFEPQFSSKLQSSSDKLTVVISKTTTSYKNEEKKFGGKPLPWE